MRLSTDDPIEFNSGIAAVRNVRRLCQSSCKLRSPSRSKSLTACQGEPIFVETSRASTSIDTCVKRHSSPGGTSVSTGNVWDCPVLYVGQHAVLGILGQYYEAHTGISLSTVLLGLCRGTFAWEYRLGIFAWQSWSKHSFVFAKSFTSGRASYRIRCVGRSHLQHRQLAIGRCD